MLVFGGDAGFWEDLLDVTTGRGQLRLVLQPLVAIFLGIRFGIGDAKSSKEPFLLRLLVKSEHRARLAKEAMKSIIVPFAIAIVLDGVLQYLAHGYVRPLAAVVIGAVLIFAPFAIARSLTNRIYRRVTHARAPAGS